MKRKVSAGWFRFFVNLWPTLLFSGIKATHISDDFKEIDVQLKLHWYNRNYVGVHYGGSLFSMTDPWYMLMLFHVLGGAYYVWDKQAEINYIKPGRGKVTAQFRLTDELMNQIKEKTATGEKYLPEFMVEIRDESNQLIATVKRTLYVKLKK